MNVPSSIPYSYRYISQAGGLVGFNQGDVLQCFATGQVRGLYRVGGLIGLNMERLKNCYATGSVMGYGFVGGLVGSSGGGTIHACYTSSSIQTIDGHAGTNVGPLVGEGEPNDISACYYSLRTDEIPYDNDFGIGLSTAEMKQASSFVDWAFSTPNALRAEFKWDMPEDGLPILYWQREETVPDVKRTPLFKAQLDLEQSGFIPDANYVYDYSMSIAEGTILFTIPSDRALRGSQITLAVSLGPYAWDDNRGDGTEENPYCLETAGQIHAMDMDPNLMYRHFRLGCDIDMTGWTYTSAVIARGKMFCGSFDGDGYTITGLAMGTFREDYLGLFRWTEESAVVRNLNVIDAYLAGDYGLGIIAAFNWGTIENCRVTGSVAGEYCIGGLSGLNRGTISGCHSEVHLQGTDSTGLIVGCNEADPYALEDCTGSGTINGEDNQDTLIGGQGRSGLER